MPFTDRKHAVVQAPQVIIIILVNLLVAQLNQAYQHVYTDMQGQWLGPECVFFLVLTPISLFVGDTCSSTTMQRHAIKRVQTVRVLIDI